MRPYQYLVFRFYEFWTKIFKKDDSPYGSISAVISVLLWFNCLIVYILFHIKDSAVKIPINTYTYIAIGLLWWINYYLAKRKDYERYNFRKGFLGGALVLLYVIGTIVLFIIIANMNRAKMGL